MFSNRAPGAALDEMWHKVSGRAPVLKSVDGGPVWLVLDNGVISRRLPEAVRDGVSMEVHALHASYARSLWFGVFDETLSHGYAVVWDSGQPGIFGSAGAISLREIDRASGEPLDFKFFIQKDGWKLLGKTVQAVRWEGVAGKLAVTGPAAVLSLDWNRATGRLTVRMGGETLIEADGHQSGDLTEAVLSGNASGLFEAVVLKMR